jgi:predicted DNA-binding transcriptional regulator YafY
MKKVIEFNENECKAIYSVFKTYVENTPENDEGYYDDYYDTYEKPIKNKVIISILSKIGESLDKNQKEEIDKQFLRKKYHTYNNYIDEKVYAKIEKAFSDLKTVEIDYFDMETAETKRRGLDVYYKSRKYTIGYCHMRKDIRKFRTSRIVSARVTNKSYTIPANFDKNRYQ